MTPDEDEVEQLWIEEIQSRLDELDNGTVKAVPWEEVRRQIFDIDDELESEDPDT